MANTTEFFSPPLSSSGGGGGGTVTGGSSVGGGTAIYDAAASSSSTIAIKSLAGTTSQITVTDNGSGLLTLSIPSILVVSNSVEATQFRGVPVNSSSTPGSVTFNGISNSGTGAGGNTIVMGGGSLSSGNGGNLQLHGGTSGSGLPGSVQIFYGANAGSVSAVFDSKGNLFINGGTGAALPTTATDQFLSITNMGGTPTGVPTMMTGNTPVVYDTAANQLYAYNSGWQQVGGGGASAAAIWVKYQYTYSSFSTAANTNTLNIVALTNTAIQGAIVLITSPLTGGSFSNYYISLGSSGTTVDQYTSYFDLLSGNTSQDTNLTQFIGTDTLTITANSVGDTLNHATGGAITVWVCLATLP